MYRVLDRFFGRKLEEDTESYLRQLALAPTLATRRNTTDLLARMCAEPGPHVTLGETEWGESVAIPLDGITKAHGLVTAGTGSGKSMLALLILQSLIDSMPYALATGFGIIDPKRDLFIGALFLLQKRLEHLARVDPPAAEELRRRIVIYDFGSRDPVSSCNILARWRQAEPDFFALNRADLLLDLLEGADGLSLGGTTVLQKLILLLSEFNLPITFLEEVLHDQGLRRHLLGRCRNRSVSTYFLRQFPSVPKPTVAALSRRMEGLFASEGVRLSLAGPTAPDFRQLQDESRIVCINIFGESISRSVRRLLQAMLVSDIGQSVFARKRKDRPFLWFCDEAQNFFLTAKLRDNMYDLACMSRSMGTHFLYITQNIATAVQDPRMLRSLFTNIKWGFVGRGDGDCDFLKPALPVTGRRVRPQADPFQEKSFYSIAEERALALEEISSLPDRVGYLWLKARSAEAIKIKTRELTMPQGRDLELATLPIRDDPSIGMRFSRQEYERLIGERDREWRVEESNLGATLEKAYRRARGGAV
jgi:hypothetical protein